MPVRSQPIVSLVIALCLLVTGCAPKQAGTSPTTTASTLVTTPSPSATPASTPSFATNWTGTPDDRSPTWDAGLDPASEYGLHLRKGLDPVLQPTTLVLDAKDAGRITEVTITNSKLCLSDVPTHPMCEFAITFNALPAGIAVGSVLNSGITKATPNGLLVKVTAIDGLRVTAMQATLTDALVQGEFWVEKAFNPDQLRAKPTLAPGVTIVKRTTSGLHKSLPGMSPLFDQLTLPGELSIDTEPVSGVHLSGSLDFGAGCGLDAGVGGSDIAWMEIGCHAWEATSLTVESTRDGAVSEEHFLLGYFPLAAFPIPIGPLVVVIIVDIQVTADLSGNVHVGLTYSASERADVRGALKFSIGNGLDHDGGVEVSGSSKGGGLKQDASVTALARAALRISAYGVLGVGVGADASLGLVGGPSQNPRWRIIGNSGIFVEMFLGFLGFELTAYIKYHLKKDFQIASGGNAPPKLTIIWPLGGEVITLGGLLPRKVEAKASDPEDGALPVQWTDTADGVTVQGVAPQSLPFTKVGQHTLTVVAVDSDGARVEKSVTVTVKKPGVTLSLRLLRANGSEFNGPPSGPAGSTLLVDAVVTSASFDPPSCAGLAWTASNATLKTDGSCRAKVTLGQPGTATISASLTDAYGTPASGSVTTHVAAAPVVITPEFLGIDVMARGGHLSEGDQLLGSDSVELSVTYLNQAEAKVTPTYSWTYTVAGQPPVVLPGGRELLTSTRSYTPSSPWGQTVTFTVVIKDAATKATLTTREFTVRWQSLPK